MVRMIAIAIMAATLAPASAEAAKFRLGGGKRMAEPAAHATVRPGFGAGLGAGVVLSPRPSRAYHAARPGDAGPAQAPFPATSPSQDAPRITTAEARKPWCGSEVVVGGFCVLN